MRLSKIKLAGFKSFVDPTILDLKSNLVAILGPNGCGKSNTIDAVRWVMGESSAKNLRGGQITDVIFNGSSSRKPVGQATVELLFDNSDGLIGGEYAGFGEISIKRQLTRDGVSQYFINQVKSRRRDVTDIFLGTGLGPRSYAIIEQGMISRFVEAKPEELRVYLEEAAGISKYKERRRETESRISDTRENLDRLNDLRQEIEKQLARLERQSEAARKFREYQSELTLLKGQLLALQHRYFDHETVQLETRIRDLTVQIEAVQSSLQNAQTQIEKQRLDHTAESDILNDVQKNYYAIGAEIAKKEMALMHHQERKETLIQDYEATGVSLNQAEVQLSADKERLQHLEEEWALAKPEQESVKHLFSAARNHLRQSNERLDDWRLDWDAFIEASQGSSRAAEVQKAKLGHLESQSRQAEDRIARLKTEHAGLNTQQIESELVEDAQQLSGKEEQLQEIEQTLLGVQAALQKVREDIQAQEQQLHEAQQTIQVAKGKQSALQSLQEAALARPSGVIEAWLKKTGVSERPQLAQILKVESGWETAVETVLQDWMQGICVEHYADLLDDLPLESAGLALLQGGVTVNTKAHDSLVPLKDKIKQGLEEVASILQDIYVAVDLKSALSIVPQLEAHQSILTQTGVWMSRQWLRLPSSGAANPKQGILVREQALQEIQQLLAEKTTTQEQIKAQLDGLRRQLKEEEYTREDLQRQRNILMREAGQLKANISGKQTKLEQVGQRIARLHQEIHETMKTVEKNDGERIAARQLLNQAIEGMAGDASTREQLTLRKQQLETDVHEARRQVRDADETHQKIAIQVERLETQIRGMKEGLGRFQHQVLELSSRREKLGAQLSAHDHPLEEMQETFAGLLASRIEAETALTTARQVVGGLEASLRQLELEKNQAQQQNDFIRQSLEKMRMDWQMVRVKRETIEEQCQKENYVLPDIIAQMPAEAEELIWRSKIEQLENRIQRLGPINLAAIEEFTAEQERKQYLDAQDADLTEALDVLEDAIKKIDKETRLRFKETHEKVNNAFQKLFPRLFGGGHASLELTGEDLLDTGLTLMARPPGKKNSLLSQLSGGEKALTAVALVFAIFQLNPAPFCILDEVDAPLDEANVNRFCQLVKEMSQDVQFIYITHNKVTMEMADYLMGVTMKEPGVSRLVSVNMEEAVEMAGA